MIDKKTIIWPSTLEEAYKARDPHYLVCFHCMIAVCAMPVASMSTHGIISWRLLIRSFRRWQPRSVPYIAKTRH